MRRLDLIGHRFGRLVVTGFAGTNNERTTWLCECDCGGSIIVRRDYLTVGDTNSCGCLAQEQAIKNATQIIRTHGESNKITPEYRAWKAMKSRCSTPNTPYFKNYGGRGIKVCEKWMQSFPAFLADVGRRPTPGHSIDRIDNDGNYEPGNVRWATDKQQNNNHRKRKGKGT